VSGNHKCLSISGAAPSFFFVLWTYLVSVMLLRKGLAYHSLAETKGAHFPLAPAIFVGLLIYVVI
jgi:hypothetical protein